MRKGHQRTARSRQACKLLGAVGVESLQPEMIISASDSAVVQTRSNKRAWCVNLPGTKVRLARDEVRLRVIPSSLSQ